jgi:hypothetical protein
VSEFVIAVLLVVTALAASRRWYLVGLERGEKRGREETLRNLGRGSWMQVSSISSFAPGDVLSIGDEQVVVDDTVVNG